ncbi:MAG: hypothetical protein PHE67_14000 [Campylobacterales bacterium]|nr:hypothetical protein [Campylobacterales bacterium]
MIRFLLILFFTVFAYGYDDLLLEAQSSVVPKIALLDKDISKKLVNGKIVVAVVYDNDDENAAKEAVNRINNAKNKNSIYPVRAIAIEFGQLYKTDMSILYVMKSSESNIKRAANSAKQKGIISFAYDKADLADGIMLSMHIERNAIISLKRSALRESGVQFSESFYKMVRIVE